MTFSLGSKIWIGWLLLCGYLTSMSAVKEQMQKVIPFNNQPNDVEVQHWSKMSNTDSVKI